MWWGVRRQARAPRGMRPGQLARAPCAACAAADPPPSRDAAAARNAPGGGAVQRLALAAHARVRAPRHPQTLRAQPRPRSGTRTPSPSTEPKPEPQNRSLNPNPNPTRTLAPTPHLERLTEPSPACPAALSPPCAPATGAQRPRRTKARDAGARQKRLQRPQGGAAGTPTRRWRTTLWGCAASPGPPLPRREARRHAIVDRPGAAPRSHGHCARKRKARCLGAGRRRQVHVLRGERARGGDRAHHGRAPPCRRPFKPLRNLLFYYFR